MADAAEEAIIGDGTTLYVQPFPATGVRHQLRVNESRDIPNNTPHKPVWSRDGRELFYVPQLGGFEVVQCRARLLLGTQVPHALRHDV